MMMMIMMMMIIIIIMIIAGSSNQWNALNAIWSRALRPSGREIGSLVFWPSVKWNLRESTAFSQSVWLRLDLRSLSPALRP